MRVQHVQQMKQAGENVFPHKYHVSISLKDFIDKYSHLQNEEVNEDIVSVAGKAFARFVELVQRRLFEQDVSTRNDHRARNCSSTICTVNQ